jgi:hypothetical protein
MLKGCGAFTVLMKRRWYGQYIVILNPESFLISTDEYGFPAKMVASIGYRNGYRAGCCDSRKIQTRARPGCNKWLHSRFHYQGFSSTAAVIFCKKIDLSQYPYPSGKKCN